MIGSNTTTNEENYLLQKFARTVSADQQYRSRADGGLCQHLRVATGGTRAAGSESARCSEGAGDSADWRQSDRRASAAGVGDPHQRAAEQGPALCCEHRRHQAGAASEGNARRAGKRIREDGWHIWQATMPRLNDSAFREAVLAEESLVVIFGSEFAGSDLDALVRWGFGRAGVKFAYLGDHANSRGAADMGLVPGSAAGLCASEHSGRVCSGVCGHAGSTGQNEARDAGGRAGCAAGGGCESGWRVSDLDQAR